MSSKQSAIVKENELETIVEPNKTTTALVEQMDRAEIKDDVTCGKVADMKVMLSTVVKDIEGARAKKLKPHKEQVKVITAVYAASLEPVKKAVERAKSLLDAWARKKLIIEREEQAKINAKQEKLLLDQAVVQDDSGNAETADALIEYAQEASNTAAKVGTVRGAYGASMGTRSTWKAEIMDTKTICAAIGRGDLPTNLVTFSKSALNDYAKTNKTERVEFGLKIVETISSVTR